VDQASALVALSEKDLEIVRATKKLAELPEKHAILEIRHKLRDIEVIAEKATVYVAQLESTLKRAEDETATISAHIVAEQAKVDSGAISNHKELQSLSREIDSLSRQKDKKENEVLAAMEKAEAGSAQAAKVADTVAKGHAKEAQLIERFQQIGGSLQRELDMLTKQRAALAGILDPALLARYEALRTAKHGLGVGVLHGLQCSACRIELPSESVLMMNNAGVPIAECPSCKRLLVIGAESSS
jgi:predicted  nucleic acid-binding Zn-ribbon protein